MAKMANSTKKKKDNPLRKRVIAQMLEGLRPKLDKAQSELDEAGVERKELSPDMVDELREGLMSIYVDADEEAHEAAMQLLVEVVSEAQPESDVDEERAEGDEEEDEEKAEDEDEEPKDKALAEHTKQLTEWSKGYNDLVQDMAGIVEVVGQIADVVKSKSEEKQEYEKRLKTMEKQLSKRPRRASNATETELDADSELGKDIEKQLFTAPAGYEDMFSNGGSA